MSIDSFQETLDAVRIGLTAVWQISGNISHCVKLAFYPLCSLKAYEKISGLRHFCCRFISVSG